MLDDDAQCDHEPVGRADDLDATLGAITRRKSPEVATSRGRADDAVALGRRAPSGLRDRCRRNRDLAERRRHRHERRSRAEVRRQAPTTSKPSGPDGYSAFWTLPLRKQRVHTYARVVLPIDQDTNALKIGVPPPPRCHHRVASVVPERRLLPADGADLRHERPRSLPRIRGRPLLQRAQPVSAPTRPGLPASVRGRRDRPSRAQRAPHPHRARPGPQPARACRR